MLEYESDWLVSQLTHLPLDNKPALVPVLKAIIWNNAEPIHWGIYMYVAFGGDE